MLATRLKAAAANGASITYNGFFSVATTTTQSTVTLTNVSFGAASSGRIVVVCIVGTITGSGSAGNISSVTIGGTAATLAIQSTADYRYSGIYYRVVPTGSSGDVVVNTTANNGTAGVQVYSYSIYNVLGTTHEEVARDQSTSTATTPSRTVTVTGLATNSIAIGLWSAGNVAATGGATWTNLTEDTDLDSASSTVASQAGLPSGSRTITCTNTDSQVARPTLLVATWA